MDKKKISIIGSGTGGCLTTSTLLKNPNLEITWYSDPNIPALSVGEGSFPFLPSSLYSDWGASYEILDSLDATIKKGIRKMNWGGSGDFNHDFPAGITGIHFNASKYQSFIIKNAPLRNITIIKEHIDNPLDLDSDHIINCTGYPNPNDSDYHISSYIPVNSVHVVQCHRDIPSLNYLEDTLTMARPYGWVFGIPLKNRYSIGYLYNKDINTLEEVQKDIKEVFKQFNLTPSNKTNSFSFNNYFRKENFSERISYNGNASSFLEPLEATTLSLYNQNANFINSILNNDLNTTKANKLFINSIKQIEGLIMLHYLAGSKYKTPFWEYAQEKAHLCINEISKDPLFKKIIFQSSLCHNPHNIPNVTDVYGTWNPLSYYVNLKGLGIYDKINKLVNI